jgi:hypothetical protein
MGQGQGGQEDSQKSELEKVDFVARVDAVFALRGFLCAVEDGEDGREKVMYLREMGGK